MTIQPSDIFNFVPVIWNQSRDVHPPLFYLLVHIVSSLFLGTFSKYIVFSINIIFYILTCIYIYKIFKLYKKEKAGIIAVILYGLSIGAISTVMLQRMYMMMTFFVHLYKGYNEYINLAKEYQNYQFIYVGINNYNHIKNLPEFTIYKESLILNETQLYLLQERNVENSFVVGIKSYLDVSNVLNEILKYTGAEEYELILEGKTKSFEANYYLITRN